MTARMPGKVKAVSFPLVPPREPADATLTLIASPPTFAKIPKIVALSLVLETMSAENLFLHARSTLGSIIIPIASKAGVTVLSAVLIPTVRTATSVCTTTVNNLAV